MFLESTHNDGVHKKGKFHLKLTSSFLITVFRSDRYFSLKFI